MESNDAGARRDVRYEPDESPPGLLSLGLGLQYAMMAVPSIVLGPTVMIQLAGGGDAYLAWAVCAALVISGVTTAVQALRVGRIGAGYVLLMGTSSAFIAICVAALEQGGRGCSRPSSSSPRCASSPSRPGFRRCGASSRRPSRGRC